MAFDMTGKVVVVTGSTGGIGRGIAEVFAEAGAHVVVTGRREEVGAQVVASLEGNGGEASFHVLDVTKEDMVKALIADTVEEFGKIDVLVNNAADVDAADDSVALLTTEQWDHMMASDVRSTFLASREVIPYMIKAGGGVILNTGSTAAMVGNLGWSAYGPAKAAVEALTKNIACQYGRQGIRCNCVRPGLIVTEKADRLMSQEFKDMHLEQIEVNRYGCPRDIGYAMLYLASDEASYVTSQVMTVDGGMMFHDPKFCALNKLAEAAVAE